MLSLQYILANTDVPYGCVSSTARRGDKWFNQVDVGDVVDLTIVENGVSFGTAVIVEKELVALRDVLDNAEHNHVAVAGDIEDPLLAATALLQALTAAYGPLSDMDETFTILHILPIDLEEISDVTDDYGPPVIRPEIIKAIANTFAVQDQIHAEEIGPGSKLADVGLDDFLLLIYGAAKVALHTAGRECSPSLKAHAILGVAAAAVRALAENLEFND